MHDLKKHDSNKAEPLHNPKHFKPFKKTIQLNRE